jgi:hemerythrin
MSGIVWRDKMAIDHGLIDDDHRHLITIINRLNERTAHGAPALATAQDTLHRLKFYAETHFAREERLQRLVSYPEHEAHRQEHGRLLAQLQQLMAVATPAELSARGMSEADVLAQLTTLLRHWLLNHILITDRGMIPYASVMARHSRGVDALKTYPVEPGTAHSPA